MQTVLSTVYCMYNYLCYTWNQDKPIYFPLVNKHLRFEIEQILMVYHKYSIDMLTHSSRHTEPMHFLMFPSIFNMLHFCVGIQQLSGSLIHVIIPHSSLVMMSPYSGWFYESHYPPSSQERPLKTCLCKDHFLLHLTCNCKKHFY